MDTRSDLRFRLGYEPASLCHTGVEELFALPALAGGAEAATAASVLGGAGETALLAGAGVAPGLTIPAAAATSTGILGTGIGLSDIGTAASVGGTLLTAKSQADQAAYEEAVARNQAAALKQKANEDAAAAERQQITQERKTALVQSRLRAVAAASGTDATSPDIVNTEGRIAQQGEYNALSSLYEGLAASRADQYQAQIDLFKARRIAAATPYAVGGTILGGIANFADRRARLKYMSSSPSSFFGFGSL